MRKFAIFLFLAFLFVGIANAQTKSMTGTVVSVERGMYAWEAIVVQVGGKKYFVYTSCPECPNTKIAGKIDEVGRKVTFSYSRIERGSDGYAGEVKATGITEVKKSKLKR
ncbi:MAG TPA: hypothetical protein VGB00_08750, partial [Pyrinomonadaceae bacterium]